MKIIQSAAAVYILLTIGALLFLVAKAAWTNEPGDYKFRGLPILVLVISAVICAVSTIASLS